jgi:23S rRNA (adenine2503-C2)-methyltransferase
MAGVNDGDAHIADLVRWCAGLTVLVNLIPFNPIPSRPEVPTAQERIDQIQALLEVVGIETRQRRTKGDGVMAACGQLGDPSQRKQTTRSQLQR